MEGTPSTVLPKLHASQIEQCAELPERILQFGEGNFLRGFVDWMVQGMNRQGRFNGKVAVVQPTPFGKAARLREQGNAYTLLMRGIHEGRVEERQEIITSIRRSLDPYREFDDFLRCAHQPELRFIVSNTTEAGIVFRAEDKAADAPPPSFPGKLTRFLLERYEAFDGDPAKGFVLLPCELIERNGETLKSIVLKMAENWGLAADFCAWVEQANQFTNTLVDRIVPGYPHGEIDALWQKAGYRDEFFDTAEIYHLWVIEGAASIAKELPLQEAGFNVVFSRNLAPYRDRKVRILNGAHTCMAPVAYLAGMDSVSECMEDALISTYVHKAIYDEVIPALQFARNDLETFAATVLERFRNPFIRHQLLSISLNSVAKFRARVLPSLEARIADTGSVPRCLAFGLAALIAFHRGTEISGHVLLGGRGEAQYEIKDELPVLETFADMWSAFERGELDAAALAGSVLERRAWWGKDLRALPGLESIVAADLKAILCDGMATALARTIHP